MFIVPQTTALRLRLSHSDNDCFRCSSTQLAGSARIRQGTANGPVTASRSLLMQVVHNHEVLYTIPKPPLKGVLIVLPACDTFVVEWGFASHGCQHCTGPLTHSMRLQAACHMPELVAIKSSHKPLSACRMPRLCLVLSCYACTSNEAASRRNLALCWHALTSMHAADI